MSDDPETGLRGPWLAVRLGVDPVALEARRRAGELYAVRPEGSADWTYPSWQFEEELRVRPEVARVFEAAGDRKLSTARLEELFQRRVGLAGGKTLLELLREGDAEPLLRAIGSG